jgi:electron transfer flavoprotein alpha/beta subunit
VKTIVLVKQIPRPDRIEFDQETKALRREGVPLVLSEYDRFALSHAVTLGGEVVAMTMGPPQAEEALRECLALGADRAVHLSDPVFALADTVATSRTLALAIEKEGADLVLCGRKTLDSETSQVPPEVAARLGWPSLTGAASLHVEDGRLRVVRETDDGDETYELEPPAVVSVSHVPPEQGRAGGSHLEVWTAADLGLDPRLAGQVGSPTRVLAVRDVTPDRAGAAASSPEEAAELVRALLEERRPDPTSWEKPERLGEKPGKSYDCWTCVELREGSPTRHSLELLAKGRELAGKLGGRNVALLLERGIAPELARAGAELVVIADSGEYHPETRAHALAEVLHAERPHVLLIPASARGREYGPRAAGELELGMTGDCVNVGIDRAGRLIQTKPAYGGNIVSVIMGATTPQLATVRPRMFEPLEPREAYADVRFVELDDLPEPRLRLVSRGRTTEDWRIDEADVVVGIGEGVEVGGVDGAVVAPATKIGLLGRHIAPHLYVAVGAPAGFEHHTGTVKAAVIVAVRCDPALPADVRFDGEPEALLDALLPLPRG